MCNVQTLHGIEHTGPPNEFSGERASARRASTPTSVVRPPRNVNKNSSDVLSCGTHVECCVVRVVYMLWCVPFTAAPLHHARHSVAVARRRPLRSPRLPACCETTLYGEGRDRQAEKTRSKLCVLLLLLLCSKYDGQTYAVCKTSLHTRARAHTHSVISLHTSSWSAGSDTQRQQRL